MSKALGGAKGTMASDALSREKMVRIPSAKCHVLNKFFFFLLLKQITFFKQLRGKREKALTA